MSSIITIALILFLQAAPPARPAASQQKNVDVEIKDPLQQAAVLFEAAQSAHQSGDLEKAIEYYGEALKRNPTLWPAEFQRSVAYLSLGRLKEARPSIDRAIYLLSEFSESPELQGITARAYVVSGEIALAESNKELAEAAYKKALEKNPRSGQAHAGLAELLLGAQKPEEAAAEAELAIAGGDDRSSTWTVLGTAQSMTGKNDEALTSLTEAIKRNPRQIPALRIRADIYIQKKQFKAAIADMRAAAALDPDISARLHLAEVLSLAKEFDEAIEIYRKAVTAEPDNAEARAGLALALIDSGKATEAITQLEAIAKSQPTRADVHAQLAELYLGTQPEKSLVEYSTAAKLEPDEPRHQIGIASAMVRLRRFQEAIPLLREVLTRGLRDEVAYFAHTNLGTALFELDDFAGAAAEYLWVLKRQQIRNDQRRAAVTLYFIGICFDKLGDFEQALKAYEQFLTLASPDNQLEIDKVKLRLPTLRRQLADNPPKRKKN
jgi:tetratricopeptide (TPR) repeat protein